MDSEITINNISKFKENNQELFSSLEDNIDYICSQLKIISKNQYNNKKIHCYDSITFTNKDKSIVNTSIVYIISDLFIDFYKSHNSSSTFSIKNRENFSTTATNSYLFKNVAALEKDIAFSSILFYIKFNIDIYTHTNLNELKNLFQEDHLNLTLPIGFIIEKEELYFKKLLNTSLSSNLHTDKYLFNRWWTGACSFSDIVSRLNKGLKIHIDKIESSSDRGLASPNYNFFRLNTINDNFISIFNKKTQDKIKKIIINKQPKANVSYDLSNKMAIKIFESSLPEKLTQKYYSETLDSIILKNRDKQGKLQRKVNENLFLSLILKKYGFDTINSLKYMKTYIDDFINDYFDPSKDDILDKTNNLKNLDPKIVYSIFKNNISPYMGSSKKAIFIFASLFNFPEDKRKELFDSILDYDLFGGQAIRWEDFDVNSLKIALETNDLALFYKVFFDGYNTISYDGDWNTFRGFSDELLSEIKLNYFHTYMKRTFFFRYDRHNMKDVNFNSFNYNSDTSKDMEKLYNTFLEVEKLAIN